MLGEQLDIGAQPFAHDIHMAPQAVFYSPNVLLGRKRRDGLAELLLRRKRRQYLLHVCEPSIEIFEMSDNHDVVHGAKLQENRGQRAPPS